MLKFVIYLLRYLFWNFSNVSDYKRFYSIKINCKPPVFNFRTSEEIQLNDYNQKLNLSYSYKGKKATSSLDLLLALTKTTGFIIIKDDAIFYEKYFNGYTRNSVCTSFSMSKSVTSALVGIAIGEKSIPGVDTSIVNYIPELNGRGLDSVKIKHLLTMSSGIKYNPKHVPWADEPKSYYFPDIKKLVFAIEPEYEPGKYFKYSNYNTILLGIILERVLKKSPALYLEDKIWKPLGMEFPASWSVDSKKKGFVKMESGINARTIDFAKIGRLFLNKGNWNGTQIIPENWIEESTSPFFSDNANYYYAKNYPPYSMFFINKKLYYSYSWWGLTKENGKFDYIAIGYHGQFIYICPENNIIIVRNGLHWGKINWWPGIFMQISDLV